MHTSMHVRLMPMVLGSRSVASGRGDHLYALHGASSARSRSGRVQELMPSDVAKPKPGLLLRNLS